MTQQHRSKVFLGNDPLRIWLCAITVSGNALLSCYWVVQTLSCKLLAVTLSLLSWYFMVPRYFASVIECCVVWSWCSHWNSHGAVRAYICQNGPENVGKPFLMHLLSKAYVFGQIVLDLLCKYDCWECVIVLSFSSVTASGSYRN